MHRLSLCASFLALLGLVLASSGAGDPPPLRIDVASTFEATSTAGASVTYHVNAYDPGSGNPVAATCTGGSGSGDFDVTVTLAIGQHTIHCDATLEDLSTVSDEKSVKVQDTTAPSFSSVSQVAVSTTDPNGTAVTYDPPTATDLGESVAVTCAPASGDTFSVGSTQVDCSANDGRGNTGHAFFNVVVTLVDDQAPTFTTVPSSTSHEATGPGGAAVSWTIEAKDNIDSSPTVTCSPTSGATFALGTTPVSCTASDDAGNTSAPVSFDVTVVDTTDPTLSLPGNQHVQTENPAGTAVNYSASASDTVAGPISPNCLPASGTTFTVGTTTVNCSANDGNGRTTSGSFTVTVELVDHTAPKFSGVPANRQVEANGASGSIVNYSTPTATDTLDGPIALVNCSPASGTTFAIGTTVVTCSATDAHGNLGSASFSLTVADTTPPTLLIPAPLGIHATTTEGIPRSPALDGWLSSASAADIVDPSPVVANNAPLFLPIGTTDVTFTARDASGNATSRSSAIVVLPVPPPGTPPIVAPPAPRAPDNPRNLTATPGDGSIKLSWAAVPGAKRYLVYRSAREARQLSALGHGDLVYSGTARTFTDRGLKNGVEYRYVVVVEDAAGNQSVGVAIVVVPRRDLLRSPKNGARLRKAPRLVWTADAEADYYNAQLVFGRVKVLSVWPTRAQFQLKTSWKFQGRKYTLKPGLYTWYVWPGYGAREAIDYGQLMGSRTFRITKKTK